MTKVHIVQKSIDGIFWLNMPWLLKYEASYLSPNSVEDNVGVVELLISAFTFYVSYTSQNIRTIYYLQRGMGSYRHATRSTLKTDGTLPSTGSDSDRFNFSFHRFGFGSF
jgi:hypothetical protein